MNEAKTKYFTEHYPTLYQNLGGDPRKTAMAWGLEVGDGWFDLLKELSDKLEPLGIIAAQVKEKFGGLRFYTEPFNEDIYDSVMEAINIAEVKSYKTCSICGDPGQTKGGGWVSTLCPVCRNNQQGDIA